LYQSTKITDWLLKSTVNNFVRNDDELISNASILAHVNGQYASCKLSWADFSKNLN